MVVGGISNKEKPPSEDVIRLVKELGGDINSKIYESCVASNKGSNSGCSKSLELEPVSYKSQVVAGANYFVKLRTVDKESNQESYWHARIFEQPWTNTKEVTSVKGPEQRTSAITYF